MSRGTQMGMIHCSFCGKESLEIEGACQFCGGRVKRPFWKRKLRWNEAYGVLVTVVGISLLGYVKPLGVLLMVAGIVLGMSWFVRSRVR